MDSLTKNENWEVLRRFLPLDWRTKGKELGALRRQRKITNPDDLLRMLLIHLADGCSLRETVVRARQGGIGNISDVALLKRLRGSSDWLRWMAVSLLGERQVRVDKPSWLSAYNVRSVDASVITEPGSTGTDWRLHYSLELFGLRCDHFEITRPEVGESFLNYPVNEADLMIGDRAYGRLKGMWSVKRRGGEFLVRFKNKAFSMTGTGGKEFSLLKELRQLTVGRIGDWRLQAQARGHESLPLRLCAVKKSEEAAAEAVKQAIRQANKKQRSIDPKTIELQRYVILLCSCNELSAEQITELYRARWQIELAFKRLKSIMGLGHLPKVERESARAWLHGKLLVALLVQAIVDEGRRFSPWGYALELHRSGSR